MEGHLRCSSSYLLPRPEQDHMVHGLFHRVPLRLQGTIREGLSPSLSPARALLSSAQVNLGIPLLR